jgi:hypothetical protein
MSKMSHSFDEASGQHVFAFGPEGSAGSFACSLKDFPEHVVAFFANFGLKTKLRNFTAAEKDEAGGTITPEQMLERLKKGAELLMAGTLRVAREAGEKGAGGTLLLEATYIYRRMKAEARGEEFTETPADVAKLLDALSDEQVEQLKGTSLFKAALAEAKLARAAKAADKAKKAALAEADEAAI